MPQWGPSTAKHINKRQILLIPCISFVFFPFRFFNQEHIMYSFIFQSSFVDFAKHLLTPFSSVQFSLSVMSNSLRPHESQHARPPCPSPTPGVHSNPRPSSRWCHPAISSSFIPFSSCPQSLPASESFPMSQLFTYYSAIKRNNFESVLVR